MADVLFGDVEPGGRLPCTLPARLEDTPALLDTPPEPGVLRYQEGVFAGHRWYDVRAIEPAFPFGHGLGYTTFEIGAPVVASSTMAAGERVDVAVEVTNTGDRAGTEVVQLYVGDLECSVRRPHRELRAFAKVRLEPGASSDGAPEAGAPGVRLLGPGREGAWVAEPGEFHLWAGRSSRSLSAPTTVVLTERWSAPASAPIHPG